jgi:CxxC motif-containing protein
MPTKKHCLICIGCPLGCRLTVTEKDGWRVEGNTCKRGAVYAVKELTNPTRVLPTTVKIKDGFLKRLPVRTAAPLPKNKIFEAMQVINRVEVEAPVKMGDVIIENILGTGVNVIASRSMTKKG